MQETNQSFSTSTNQPHGRIRLWIEIAAVLILLGFAIFLRLWELGSVPAGFHFDEAIDLKIALDITKGARPIYAAEGWGREGLYYYLVALVLQIVPYNPLALRVSAVICGVVVLITAYFLVKIWHSRLAAWFAVALLSVAYWPLSASRFGVRHISLALMLGITSWCLWRLSTQTRHLRWYFALTGFLAGLTMYTYQPARFVPFIFVAFAFYLNIFHRGTPWANWRLWLIWLAMFTAVSLPLIIILSNSGSSLETEQRAFTIEPITQLLDGNPQLIIENTIHTAQVFTVRGDPLKSYNVPDRPIFVPAWTSIFFYVGFLLALWRWRQPVYAFALLWLFFMLLPTIVTITAPNFNRIVAAQLPIMFLAAVPMAELIQWVQARQKRWELAAAGLLMAAVFISLTAATWRDYFEVWPVVTEDVHTLNREVAAVADYLEHTPDTRSAVISSRDISDEDPYIVSVSLDRDDFPIRWVDTTQALAIPAAAEETRLIVTRERWVDEALLNLLGGYGELTYQQPEFNVYTIKSGAWATAGDTTIAYLTPDIAIPSQATAKPLNGTYPYAFCHCSLGETGAESLQLTGISTAETWQLGQDLELITTWQPLEDNNFVSLALFVHLINTSGEIVTQYDGLGYPPHTWRSGDMFAQLARLPLGTELAPGEYWLQFGLYERETGQRWLLLDKNGRAIGDRVLVGPLMLDEQGQLHFQP